MTLLGGFSPEFQQFLHRRLGRDHSQRLDGRSSARNRCMRSSQLAQTRNRLRMGALAQRIAQPDLNRGWRLRQRRMQRGCRFLARYGNKNRTSTLRSMEVFIRQPRAERFDGLLRGKTPQPTRQERLPFGRTGLRKCLEKHFADHPLLVP